MPANIDEMNIHLKTYLKSEKRSLHFSKLTQDLLGYSSNNDYPCGHWSKAADTPIMCDFVVWFLSQPCRQAAVNADPILLDLIVGGKAMHVFMKQLYDSELWLTRDQAQLTINAGYTFLSSYNNCAVRAYEKGLCLFSYKPKLHYLHHIVLFMAWQYDQLFNYVLSPLCEATPMDEDLVGRTSRLSRHVSPMTTGLATMNRYLVAANIALEEDS